jgi:hypothetical protein
MLQRRMTFSKTPSQKHSRIDEPFVGQKPWRRGFGGPQSGSRGDMVDLEAMRCKTQTTPNRSSSIGMATSICVER